jgi:peptidoglycan hydrolase-like protein with peptidoglycan-binding domain
MSYFLLDHKNPHGNNFYEVRREPILAVVMHVTAGLQDQGYVGNDLSAEATAQYAASTDRKVSWHSASDSDSHFQLVPDKYVAFQCVGYNSVTIGHEISKRDVTWQGEPQRWVDDTITQAAHSLRRVADLGIPFRRATRAELDRERKKKVPKPVGFVTHAELDPERRSDPGGDFPWGRFLVLLGAADPAPAPTIPFPKSHNHKTPTIQKDGKADKNAVKDLQAHMNAWRHNRPPMSTHQVDGIFDEWTHVALTTFQKWYGLSPDGICKPVDWNKIHTITKGARLDS